MARREGEEISAGSMADIAFLLLIFFIVTTTMELEAGIPQQLAMKVELPPDFIPPEVKQRDVFSIAINENDQLRVENESHEEEEIGEMVYNYFTANMYQNTDELEARYVAYTTESCKEAIKMAEQELTENTEDLIVQSRILKWEKRLMVCEALPDAGYREIHETAVVQVKQKAKTSYGMYISVVNEVKKVINKVRDEKCKEIFNGLSYYDLDMELDEDKEKMKILRVLVPERIIEPAIKN